MPHKIRADNKIAFFMISCFMFAYSVTGFSACSFFYTKVARLAALAQGGFIRKGEGVFPGAGTGILQEQKL
jgi:hypothetical protein